MGKVPGCKGDTLRFEDYEDDDVIYEIENDEMVLHRFEQWKEFRENAYYDGTPPPDFVTVVNREER